MKQRTDLDDLREQFPSWQITTVWATACTGPDARRPMAYRCTGHRRVLLTAWTAPELRQKIRDDEEPQ